jgi:hypothetical protein
MFWEFDGQTLFVVKRSSTFQLAGSVTVNVNSQRLTGTLTGTTGTITGASSLTINPGDTSATITCSSHTLVPGMYTTALSATFAPLGTVWVISTTPTTIFVGFVPYVGTTLTDTPTGTFVQPTTRFQDQLKVNDKFTLRGMTHQVTSIQGQGILTFNPPFRGSSNIVASGAVTACKIKENSYSPKLVQQGYTGWNWPIGFQGGSDTYANVGYSVHMVRCWVY